MRSVTRLAILPLTAALLVGAGACAAAAAGAAGAAGAVYYNQRGAESMVNTSVEQTAEAVRRAFTEFHITETRARSEQERGESTEVLEGTTPDREVKVTIAAEGGKSKVDVVARKSAVTWDKDLAKAILERVVSLGAAQSS